MILNDEGEEVSCFRSLGRFCSSVKWELNTPTDAPVHWLPSVTPTLRTEESEKHLECRWDEKVMEVVNFFMDSGGSICDEEWQSISSGGIQAGSNSDSQGSIFSRNGIWKPLLILKSSAVKFWNGEWLCNLKEFQTLKWGLLWSSELERLKCLVLHDDGLRRPLIISKGSADLKTQGWLSNCGCSAVRVLKHPFSWLSIMMWLQTASGLYPIPRELCKS